jgi:hypothetical protein
LAAGYSAGAIYFVHLGRAKLGIFIGGPRRLRTKILEGEIVLVSMPGTQAEKFMFTVKDDAVAKKVNDSLGKRVKLTYEEHKGIPTTCFGETAYFVKDIVFLEK